jgi:mycoredoxin-dependent peroxiredoxin
MTRFMARAALLALALAPVSAAVAQQPSQAPAPAPPPPPAVKVGEAAPDFALPWFAPVDGGKFEQKQVRLSDFKGKQNVVLAFFPAAFSPGCTSEMEKYRDSSTQLTDASTAVLGVSVDSTWANRAFREQIGASFPILSDWKKEVSRQYGLLDENTGYARRATFVIDKQGVVQKVDLGKEALDPSAVVGLCQKLSKAGSM